MNDLSNVPAFEAIGVSAFDEPREAVAAELDDNCAAVLFQQEGRDMRDTAFLRWQDGEWLPQTIITGETLSWLDGSAVNCYTPPE